MTEHIPDDLLIEYADDPSSHPEIEAHLNACSECWNRLSFYRTLNAELREEETWSAEEELRVQRGQQAVRAFADRIAAEDAEAHRLLDTVVDSPYRFARARIPARKRFRTGGVVRLLCEAVREECKNEPPYALVLAETAQLIAELLPDDYYPSRLVFDLRGRAWKEYAVVCRHLARYEAGLHALNRAERAYRHVADSGVGMAAVNLARAILLWKVQRYPEALSFAQSASREYERRRNKRQFIEAQEVEAVILQRTGEHLRARTIYQRAFDAADDLENWDMKARSAQNLGVSYRESGDLGSASTYFLVALQLYENFNQHALAARARWSIARLSLAGGNFIEAVKRLRRVIPELESKGLMNDVADAKLDLAEALLMIGEISEVEMVCSEIAVFYRHSGIANGALLAAAFLREAAFKRTLRRHHLEHVRHYLSAVRETPDLPFAPPPPSP
jgi:tetratricopeptide (TPR) repeat protein